MVSLKARLFPAGTWLLRLLPRRLALGIAYAVADLVALLPLRRRQTVDDNLQRIAPDADLRQRRQLTRSLFRHFAGIWVDFLCVPFQTPAEIGQLFRWDTRRHLDAALAHGNGVIIVTAHVGALDLTGVYLAAQGYPISVVVEDLEPAVHNVWQRYRGATGMRVLSRRRGSVAVHRALRRGEIVALVIDRVIDGAAVEVEFCRGRRLMPTGPAAFALRSGAPIVVLRGTRRDASGYDLVTEPATFVTGTAESATRELAVRLSQLVREFPDQWFVFSPHWLDSAHAPTAPLPDAAPCPDPS